MKNKVLSIPYIEPRAIVPYIATLIASNPTIVEAGAFTGSNTIQFARRWPHGIIHAFEPIPDLFTRLCENTLAYSNVYRHQLALGTSNGTATLHIAEKRTKPGIPSQASSLLTPHDSAANPSIHFPRTLTVPTITLDTFAAKNDITSIDLLWLDLQGMELSVLQAVPNVVYKTRYIFVEVALIERYQEQPLAHEVIDWFEKNRFEAIARDFDPMKATFGNILFSHQSK